VSVGDGAMLAERAREVGAVPLSDEKETTPGPLLKKLLNSMSGAVADKKEETKVQKTMHLVKNLQPLPKKIVEDTGWHLRGVCLVSCIGRGSL